MKLPSSLVAAMLLSAGLGVVTQRCDTPGSVPTNLPVAQHMDSLSAHTEPAPIIVPQQTPKPQHAPQRHACDACGKG